MYALDEIAAIHSFAPCPDHDRDVADRAEQRLRTNPYLALKNIHCEFERGTLVLYGRLPTYYLKQVASAAVSDLEAVQRVVNQIDVVSSPRL